MTDRHEQARAEAERRSPKGLERYRDEPVYRREGFMDGAAWADANHPAVEALARVRELHSPRTVVREVENGHLRDTQGPCKGCDEWWPCKTYEATEVEG